MDTVLPPTELGDRDISVGDLVEERLGKEVVDRLVEPLLGGVYAGHAREISARAAVPQLVALLEHDRSLTRAAAAATPPPDPTTLRRSSPASVGEWGGSPRALARASGATVRTGATVRDLARRPGGGWNLVVGPTRDPEVVAGGRGRARHAGARDGPAAQRRRARRRRCALARIEYASMAIVTLAVPGTRRSPRCAGSGFLVPPVDGRAVKASTFSFAKWDWVRAAGRRDRGPVLRAALLAGSPPRGADPPAQRRGAGRAGAGRPRRRDRALGAPGRHARAAVGRCAAAVRRRSPRPGRLGAARAGARCPGSRSAVRRTTASASRPASPPRTLAAAKVVGGPCDNGAMTRNDLGRRREGTRAQRHDPLHDVVGVPAARRARRGRLPPRGGPRGRGAGRQARGRRRRRPRASTTSAACAPTPT